MDDSLNLTIYTVSGPSESARFDGTKFYGGWRFLKRNLEIWEYYCGQDSDLEVSFYIVHDKSFGDINELKIQSNTPNFKISVIEVESSTVIYRNGSQQHGELLNYILRTHPPISKFYAVIDPDCYLLNVRSLKKVLVRMQRESIPSAGVSYPNLFPPQYYWDFPVAYFQIFWQPKIPVEFLDFVPGYENSLEENLRDSKIPLLSTIIKFKFIRKFGVYLFDKIRESNSILWKAMYLFLSRYTRKNVYEAKDTGWKNRLTFQESKIPSLVIPIYCEQKKIFLPFFNHKEYRIANCDLPPQFNSSFHFILHGLYENRHIGDQSFFYRELARRVRTRGIIEKSQHPLSSVEVKILEQPPMNEEKIIQNLARAYLYLFEGAPFCVHLSHALKKNVENCENTLESIMTYVKLKN